MEAVSSRQPRDRVMLTVCGRDGERGHVVNAEAARKQVLVTNVSNIILAYLYRLFVENKICVSNTEKSVANMRCW